MYFMCAQDLDWSISALCVDSKKKKSEYIQTNSFTVALEVSSQTSCGNWVCSQLLLSKISRAINFSEQITES